MSDQLSSERQAAYIPPSFRSPDTLHAGVLDELGPAIAGGELAAGSVLTLEQIVSRFGVSRTVAREAVRVLESMGLVAGRRRIGITVQPSPLWNVFDPQVIRWRLSSPDRAAQLRSLNELRAAVEPPAAASAAVHASAVQRDRLLELSAEMTRTGEAADLETFLALDVEFHRIVLEASGNEMFAALATVVAEVLAGRTMHGLMPTRPRPEALAGHRDAAAAIAAGDPVAAEAALRAVVTEVVRRFAPD